MYIIYNVIGIDAIRRYEHRENVKIPIKSYDIIFVIFKNVEKELATFKESLNVSYVNCLKKKV